MRLPGGEKYVVGYDIGDTYVQISYANMNNNNVETISSVAGEEIYKIPAVLCKKPGTQQWSYGREALKCAEEEQGILVDNLFALAVDGEPILIEGESYDELMDIAKECIKVAIRAGVPKASAYLKVNYCPEGDILTIDQKIGKYR